MASGFIVDWDIPTKCRRMFYYHLKKIRLKYEIQGTMSTASVMHTDDRKLAEDVFNLATKYGKANLYAASLVRTNWEDRETAKEYFPLEAASAEIIETTSEPEQVIRRGRGENDGV